MLSYIYKVGFSRYRPCVAQWVCRGIDYSFMTAALEGGEWSAVRPGCTLTPGKDPAAIVQETICMYMYICIYIYLYLYLHVKWPLYLSDFKEIFSGQIFEKYCNMNYRDFPSTGSRVFPCGLTEQACRNNEANCRFFFQNFANAKKSKPQVLFLARVSTVNTCPTVGGPWRANLLVRCITVHLNCYLEVILARNSTNNPAGGRKSNQIG